METIAVTIRIEKNKIERLKQMAREKSYKKKEDITYSDLIREGVDIVLKENKGGKSS